MKTVLSSNWFSRNGEIPDVIVFHQKNVPFPIAKKKYLTDGSRESVHFYVTLSGEVYRFLPITVAACNDVCSEKDPLRVDHWSRSVSKLVKERGKDPSAYTVSVEFESAGSGFLTKSQFDAGVKTVKAIIGEIKEVYGTDVPVDREHFLGRYRVAPLMAPYSPGLDFPLGKIIDACRI